MKKCSESPLIIKTLGSFSVLSGDTILSEESKRSQKKWLLFKYIITNITRRIPTEEIINILWNGNECDNPQKALQNLVYRLRGTLAPESAENAEMYIRYSQGCYFWNSTAAIQFDAMDFEKHVTKGQWDMQSGQNESAIDSYRAAMSIYRGNYLSESASLDWVVPVSNYYNRSYLNACNSLARLLIEMKRPEEAVSVCEEAFRIEPYEEPLHICFMQALTNMGKNKQARQHYNYITTTFAREFGVRVSDDMYAIFNQVSDRLENMQMDLDVFQELLAEKNESKGALFCDSNTFKSICQLEMRRSERIERIAFLMVITLMSRDYTRPNDRALKDGMELLSKVLTNILRRGDVVSCWNDSQYVLLSPTQTTENGELVLRRIVDRFNELNKNKNIFVSHRIKAVKILQ